MVPFVATHPIAQQHRGMRECGQADLACRVVVVSPLVLVMLCTAAVNTVSCACKAEA
jgi:hypothetical protein